MIFYCNVSGTAQVVAKELAQYFKVDYINIKNNFFFVKPLCTYMLKYNTNIVKAATVQFERKKTIRVKRPNYTHIHTL